MCSCSNSGVNTFPKGGAKHRVGLIVGSNGFTVIPLDYEYHCGPMASIHRLRQAAHVLGAPYRWSVGKQSDPIDNESNRLGFQVTSACWAFQHEIESALAEGHFPENIRVLGKLREAAPAQGFILPVAVELCAIFRVPSIHLEYPS